MIVSVVKGHDDVPARGMARAEGATGAVGEMQEAKTLAFERWPHGVAMLTTLNAAPAIAE